MKNLKRIAFFFYTVWILAVLSGCVTVLPEQPLPASSAPTAISAAVSDYSAEFADNWCYKTLSSALQNDYAVLYAAVKDCNVDKNVVISGTPYLGVEIKLTDLLNSDQTKILFTAFTQDNPAFFYIGNTYSYGGYQDENDRNINTFCLTFTMSVKERQDAAVKLDAAVSAIEGGIPKDADEFGKELWLHDRLMEKTVYDDQTANSGDPYAASPNAFTAYGALVEGKAVCEGYSRAMELLLHKSGIACTLVSGEDKKTGGSHMWDMVTVDGLNYHLDPTWDDGAADDPASYYRHVYFNLNDTEIQLTHTIDNDNVGISSCTGEDANYYRRLGLYLDTYDSDAIGQVIAGVVETGNDRVDLRFSPATYGNAQLLVNNFNRLSDAVNQYLTGGQTMWEYIYQTDDDYGTVTLFKK